MSFLIPIAYAQGVADTPSEGIREFIGLFAVRIPFFIAAIVILFLSYVIGRIAKRAAQRAILRSGRHEGALSIVGKTVFVSCFVLGLTIALKVAGIDISFIVGASGFGLGFALKSVLENYIAGVIILVQEPFRIGDMIQVKEYFGRVEQIEARTTFIRLFDGQRIVIPNSDMITNAVINFSTFPERRLTLQFGVAYDADMPKVLQVALDALKQEPRILQDPPPMVTFGGYGESTINVIVRFWIDNTLSNWLEMTSIGTQLVGQAFNKNGIIMPYPVRTLSMNPLDSDDLYELLAKKKGEMHLDREPGKN